jgi:hypothetical protein
MPQLISEETFDMINARSFGWVALATDAQPALRFAFMEDG